MIERAPVCSQGSSLRKALSSPPGPNREHHNLPSRSTFSTYSVVSSHFAMFASDLPLPSLLLSCSLGGGDGGAEALCQHPCLWLPRCPLPETTTTLFGVNHPHISISNTSNFVDFF